MTYSKRVKTARTNAPVTTKIDSHQVKNRAGGYVFKVGDWGLLDRFLILGTDKPAYYVNSQTLTLQAASAVTRCLQEDGKRVVDTAYDVLKNRRAPKVDPAVFVLALALKTGDVETRRYAAETIPHAINTAYQLFLLKSELDNLGGLGKLTKKALVGWYQNRNVDQLAYQMAKYRSRHGWTHRDMLRVLHLVPRNEQENALFAWATKGIVSSDLHHQVRVMESIKNLDFNRKTEQEVVRAITGARLTWEMLPTQFLNSPLVWEALLQEMPDTAVLRNLAKMTSIGLLAPLSNGTRLCVEKLENARFHPLKAMVAQSQYRAGQGYRGNLTWTPVPQISDALDVAFFNGFGYVEPTGLNVLLGVDVSSSMTHYAVPGFLGTTADELSRKYGWLTSTRVPGAVTAAHAAAAMMLVTARVEKNSHILGFDNGVRDLGLKRTDTLSDVVTKARFNSGSTNISLPILWAMQHKVPVDLFVVYTDNETWKDVHPYQALKDYRDRMGINAKLVSVAMVADEYSVADPNDYGMLDVVGFDTAAPSIISDFATP